MPIHATAPGGPVLVYVQHSLGVGHLKRATVLARGLAARGCAVTLVTGGRPVPHLEAPDLRVLHLPPLAAADMSFSGLVDADGAPVTAALWAARRTHLDRIAEAVRPALLVVEMFPFGRSAFATEIEGLIAKVRHLRPDARVVCSVRDILVRQNRPEKTERMLDAANRLFDLILVHGDPHLIPFGATFPAADRLEPPVIHTGYIVETAAEDRRAPTEPDRADGADRADRADRADGHGEVLVSAGGGAMGRALMAAAIAARPLCAATGGGALPWRVLVGRNLGADALADLRARAAPGVIVEWARADFGALLARARLSVSQAGYNTSVETVAAGTPAVLVPWGEGTETEQRDRARALARLGLACVLETAAPRPETLAAAVDEALSSLPHRSERPKIALDGLARSVETVLTVLDSPIPKGGDRCA